MRIKNIYIVLFFTLFLTLPTLLLANNTQEPYIPGFYYAELDPEYVEIQLIDGTLDLNGIEILYKGDTVITLGNNFPHTLMHLPLLERDIMFDYTLPKNFLSDYKDLKKKWEDVIARAKETGVRVRINTCFRTFEKYVSIPELDYIQVDPRLISLKLEDRRSKIKFVPHLQSVLSVLIDGETVKTIYLLNYDTLADIEEHLETTVQEAINTGKEIRINLATREIKYTFEIEGEDPV